ncbi:MAG: hypothetical protein K0Q94_4182 [Paenibacillus sp.]|nr:hypothetical protein [Paenibacillus sp.]
MSKGDKPEFAIRKRRLPLTRSRAVCCPLRFAAKKAFIASESSPVPSPFAPNICGVISVSSILINAPPLSLFPFNGTWMPISGSFAHSADRSAKFQRNKPTRPVNVIMTVSPSLMPVKSRKSSIVSTYAEHIDRLTRHRLGSLRQSGPSPLARNVPGESRTGKDSPDTDFTPLSSPTIQWYYLPSVHNDKTR